MILRIFDIKTGLFLRDDFIFDEKTEIAIKGDIPEGFYHPKWDGEKWVEGKTQAEIDAILASSVVVDEQDELDNAIAAATTLTQLKDALLGKNRLSKAKAERK